MSNCDGYFLFIWLSAHCLVLKVHSLNQVGEWVLFTICIYSDYFLITFMVKHVCKLCYMQISSLTLLLSSLVFCAVCSWHCWACFVFCYFTCTPKNSNILRHGSFCS
ncbi:hypothetical protein NC653_014817 [Populus alba x Populus x berolinensis]|uniref:Uncharacterized protein n=1 Tax=Populus alba x Populus x berolinensis TaxID=444605 RepID=A0AAD6QYC5_9ROSI|nr:hypothetical protein NC653_014817 [Populus alba x Populus x berolinensis]